ncbi:MAG: S8 family serine peptidase [Candidatus Zixiibacteriota bacterium]
MGTKKAGRRRSRLIFTVVILLISAGLSANTNGEFEEGRLVCEMRAGYNINYINGLYGTTTVDILTETNAYLLQAQPGQDAESLAAAIILDTAVLYCGANYYLDAPEPFQRSSPFLDNQFIGTFEDQPAADVLSLTTVHTVSTGTAVKVAIIDTGLNFDHPQFAAKSAHVHSGYDFVDDDLDATDEPGGVASGHGTFVAGAIALVAPGADLYAYRTLDTLGRGTGYTLARSIVRAVDDGCRVINLSLGLRGSHDALQDAIDYAESLGVVVIAAAGNDSTGDENLFPFPAHKSSVIAVAAVDSLNFKADFSNWGKKVDLCAPGTRVYAPHLDTLFAWWDGTSFSAPMVTGVVALMLQIAPDLTVDAIDSLLGETAINIDAINPGYEDGLGKGLVDPVAALALLTNFMCGDADASQTISISDAVFVINYIFSGGPAPVPSNSADCDCSGMISISDTVYLINYIFAGGSPPCGSCP